MNEEIKYTFTKSELEGFLHSHSSLMALEMLRASMKKENPGELGTRMRDIIPMLMESVKDKASVN